MAPGRRITLARSEGIVGYLTPVSTDQPFLVCRFEPGPGWPDVRASFERLRAVRPGDRTELDAAEREIAELSIWATDDTGRSAVTRFTLLIDGDQTRFRTDFAEMVERDWLPR